MFTYSVTQWIFGHEEMELSLRRLKKHGYDGVELAGEPKKINIAATQAMLQQYDLTCTSICGIYTPERDLSSSKPDIRHNAIQYVKDCVDMAVQLGATVVIVVPTPVGKSGPDTTQQEEWANAVASLKEAGTYAAEKNIHLSVEALNRYETYLVNKLDVAKQFVQQVDVKSVGIMADLFHMSIEERDHAAALRSIAPHLMHVHIADNTREAAGYGQTDFTGVISTLLELGYTGNITMEFLPPVSNPYLVAHHGEAQASSIYDEYTKQSIDHIKAIVNSLQLK
ncbi:sugar phosphate isomerase/epimerase family protein [Paenibacillus xerothermodurans]|uniref:Sugar phosphate isomerase/epimerase n=1 Tax=Paenibacillus xerothermodurans TaxID=1977292 RepID=A0A2W1N8W8_PAEXE|nr:sugar phosphate isomerase/epimerase family protein [Paenibacillus xerothermodurans]PZE21069.1 sugar phosphate isomerase/epimerase [Paenibacillus xerothermodurans]